MHFAYRIKLVFYTQVPRSALPSSVNDPDLYVCEILQEYLARCVKNGVCGCDSVRAIPGTLDDYDHSIDDKQVYYDNDDVDKTNPRVNLAFASSKNNEFYEDEVRHWQYFVPFDQDTAMLVKLYDVEAYKCKSAYSSNDNTGVMSVLKLAGIDTTKTVTGYVLVGNRC